LAKYREELSTWVEQVEPGKVLMVDAPMGLGKTWSIVETLATRTELSAMVFMPTKELAEELTQALKWRIQDIRKDDLELTSDYDFCRDKDGKVVTDDDDIAKFKIERHVFKEEVWYLEGITDECVHYDEIKGRYQRKILSKRSLCTRRCAKYQNNSCRFTTQLDEAKKARVVVTTHAQYDRVYRDPSLQKWHRNGGGIPRSLFAVYEPQVFDYSRFREFIIELDEFLRDQGDCKEISEAFYNLLGKVVAVKETSLITSQDASFQIPREVKKAWRAYFEGELFYFTELPNILDFLEEAVRIGCVVQRYGANFQEEVDDEAEEEKRGVYKVFLPNPKKYDLKGMPPHVFFDGTPVDEPYLLQKLENIELNKFPLRVPPLGKLRVFQNANDDLPRKRVKEKENAVKDYVKRLIRRVGTEHKYFFFCTKKLENSYLKGYLEELRETKGLKYTLCHYNNLRGTNQAKSCRVGVMLGSFLVSDALDISYALGLIQDKLEAGVLIRSENNLWTWDGNSQRRYKEKFHEIAQIAHWIRTVEQKQGMARTRYISHDVDFYVISKDPVKEYERYAEVLPDPIGQHLFPPKKPRSDSYFYHVERIALELMDKYKKINTKMVIDQLAKEGRKISRPQTVREKLRGVAKKHGWERKGNAYCSVQKN
jgi:hypothetical protein